MASVFYNQIVNLVVSYAGPEKGPGVVQRQLKRGTATEDSFAPTDLGKIMNFLVAASTLYVPDKTRAAEMVTKLKALAR